MPLPRPLWAIVRSKGLRSDDLFPCEGSFLVFVMRERSDSSSCGPVDPPPVARPLPRPIPNRGRGVDLTHAGSNEEIKRRLVRRCSIIIHLLFLVLFFFFNVLHSPLKFVKIVFWFLQTKQKNSGLQAKHIQHPEIISKLTWCKGVRTYTKKQVCIINF